ncbi:YifB family Mg chelatase-like AAA ATPase [Corynebacterium vitaeruminis]|uniref:AAA+ ATPase domain-containing protein n=1 Tax=Corynebacterium vitaeruminis DSM 20294 TaxID=1224164 RepID=W5Y974_9CORY|nr:YifB family Mg chelatase-like AAA ATPase [Corynebacterium vitaeruminis]AHI23073.1 hypothetical protein B843_08440 [Corynebacterium vitaeruminis DSM 20294]
MALAKALSAVVVGVDSQVVEVEANVGAGLPGTFIVGLADTAIAESRDRMKTAALNSGLSWPKTKVIVSLTPASLRKSGSQLDLAMCLAILSAAAEDYAMRARLRSTMLLGEVGLDGGLREVRGVLPALLAAKAAGLSTVVLPLANAQEAQIIDGLEVLAAASLREAVLWARNEAILETASEVAEKLAPARRTAAATRHLDMSDVVGEKEAKFAAEVAAAGAHHCMLIGPPGSGKSMIAERLPTILPPLSHSEQLEVATIRSVAPHASADPSGRPPFVAPHHSITRAALLGGGAGTPVPGAVTQAHRGVLFLDEVSEIPAQTLDCLRTPIEEGSVRLVRSRQDVTFPASFQLVLAANPCRCAAEEPALCTCTSRERANYLSNISGPLRDRIDIIVRTRSRGAMLAEPEVESSAAIAERVQAVRDRAAHRWERAGFGRIPNAAMNPHVLRKRYPADEEGMGMLAAYLGNGTISQRGCDRSLRLAWTLCDLEEAARPDLSHVARALELRSDTELVSAA